MTMMNRERFEQLLDAYGADPRRWPEAERADALAFRDAHASEEESALTQARQLDALLDVARETAAPSDLLAARVLKAAPKPGSGSIGWKPMAALAACAVLGIVAGFGVGSLAPAADNDDASIGSLFGSPFGDGGEG